MHGDRASVQWDHFVFAAQISSGSTCSSVADISSPEFLSRQCTDIDTLAQYAWSETAVEDAVRAATAECRFSVTIGDPRCVDVPLIAVSEEFEAMTGFCREEILGKNCRFLNTGCELDLHGQALRESCRTGAPFTALLVNRRKSGEMFLNLLDLRGLTVANNPRTGEELWFLVGIQADVTGVAEANYPKGHLPQLQQVAAAIRERITGGLSAMAVAGALAAEALPMRQGGHADTKSWCPLPEPRWRPGEQLHAPRQVVDAAAAAAATLQQPLHRPAGAAGVASGGRHKSWSEQLPVAALIGGTAIGMSALALRHLACSGRML